MFIQNIGKRNFILSLNGEQTKVGPEEIIEVGEALAEDLTSNYKRDWKKLELPKATIPAVEKEVRQEEEKVVESKPTTRKKK